MEDPLKRKYVVPNFSPGSIPHRIGSAEINQKVNDRGPKVSPDKLIKRIVLFNF